MKIFAPSKLASSNFNNSFMEEALKQAQIAFNKNEVPVGAILVDRISHKVIVRTHNMVEQARNSLLHAEIVAINQACQLLSSKNLSQYDMYVTLEPCTMCAAAIALARIGRLFYAATDSQRGGIETRERFFNSKACFHHPEIYSGFSADISQKLIQNFFQKIRQK